MAICRAAARIAGSEVAILFEPDPSGTGLRTTAAEGTGLIGTLMPYTERSGAVTAYTSREPRYVEDIRGNPAVQQSIFHHDRRDLRLLDPGSSRRGRAGRRRDRGRLEPADESDPEDRADHGGGRGRGCGCDRARRAARPARPDGPDRRSDRADQPARLGPRAVPGDRPRRARAGAARHRDARPRPLQGLQRPPRPSGRATACSRRRRAPGGASLRETDLLARYGGEEFAVALPGCEDGVAERLVERLRAVTPGGRVMLGRARVLERHGDARTPCSAGPTRRSTRPSSAAATAPCSPDPLPVAGIATAAVQIPATSGGRGICTDRRGDRHDRRATRAPAPGIVGAWRAGADPPARRLAGLLAPPLCVCCRRPLPRAGARRRAVRGLRRRDRPRRRPDPQRRRDRRGLRGAALRRRRSPARRGAEVLPPADRGRARRGADRAPALPGGCRRRSSPCRPRRCASPPGASTPRPSWRARWRASGGGRGRAPCSAAAICAASAAAAGGERIADPPTIAAGGRRRPRCSSSTTSSPPGRRSTPAPWPCAAPGCELVLAAALAAVPPRRSSLARARHGGVAWSRPRPLPSERRDRADRDRRT